MRILSLFNAIALSGLVISAAKANEPSENIFLGVFVGSEVLGADRCKIVGGRASVWTRYGEKADFADDTIDSFYSRLLLDVFSDVDAAGNGSGFSAVINFRTGLSQSTDFLTESGSRWQRNNKRFFAEGIGVAWAYGDVVQLNCSVE